MSSAFCGFCSSPTKTKNSRPLVLEPKRHRNGPINPSRSVVVAEKQNLLRKKSADFEWAREDQLSVVLELLEDESRVTPGWEKAEPTWEQQETIWEQGCDTEREGLVPGKGKGKAKDYPPQIPLNWAKTPRTPEIARFDRVSPKDRIKKIPHYSSIPTKSAKTMDSHRTSPGSPPRPIEQPPRDLESIARIDASLIFEHFTTADAWALGSALRERLLPIPLPVVIDISLANQNQTLFRCCTHSGVMPDNDSWVSRKRKTVLRWGVSTWYMGCKFDGDEVAFREKYGLGNSAGEYAIHGGGVPIRVTGVEGVVAVVVVSGLKQNEDHGVIVEVIRELYY